MTTQFCIWTTQRLKEHIVKEFFLNDDLFKSGVSKQYFDELQQHAPMSMKNWIHRLDAIIQQTIRSHFLMRLKAPNFDELARGINNLKPTQGLLSALYSW